MLFSDVCRDYLFSLQHERGLSPRSVKTYGVCLGKYRHWHEASGSSSATLSLDEAMNTPTLRRYLYALSGLKQRPRTIRNAFAPLKGLGAYCVTNGVLTANPVLGLTLPKKDASSRPQVSTEEVKALLEAVERQNNSQRVALSRAMLSVLVFCGVRFQELLNLKIQDVNVDDKTLLVARGKGNKSRLLYPPGECLAALREWLTVRRKMSCKHDWLWAYDIGRRMGELGTRQMLEEVKAIAGLKEHRNILPHSLRHAFATRLMGNGADIKSIQAALGHSQATTTMIYLHMHEQPARAMQELGGFRPKQVEQKSAVRRRHTDVTLRRRIG